MKDSFTVGIIGGNGKMGRALIKFFQMHKQKVIFSDINTELNNREVTELSDIVVISVPLDMYETVLSEISEKLTSEKLLMDIGSLKKTQVNVMRRFHDGEILATHPLFGPEKKFYGSENSIVICKINPDYKSDFVLELFRKNKLNVIELTPEEHDRLMSFIHGFYYLFNITYLEVLKSEFGSIKRIENLMTTSFRSYINALDNIFNTQDWLIEKIAYENPYIEKVIERYINILGKRIDLKSIRDFLNEKVN